MTTLKHRLGQLVLPRLPINRRTFDVLRFELNALTTMTLVRVSPRYRRIRATLDRSAHLRVNIGSGGTGREGWINLDIGRLHGDQTLPWDIRRSLPFADGTVAMIFAEHVLEHLDFREDAPRLLKEAYRALEPGGRMRIVVPDAERWLRAYVTRDPAEWRALGMPVLPDDMPTPMSMINHVFHQSGEHFFGYDYETLRHVLVTAGFGADCVDRGQFAKGGVPDLLLDQPHHAPYSLYVEAWKDAPRGEAA